MEEINSNGMDSFRKALEEIEKEFNKKDYSSEGKRKSPRKNLFDWEGFIESCYELTKYLPKEFPIIDKNSNKKSLIVECRELKHNEFVIKNTIHKLGDGWGHIIYCHKNNYNQIKSICDSISDQIEIKLLDKDLDRNGYNNLLLDLNFWNDIDCEKVLIYQTDTFILNEFKDKFLKWDYLGAGWGSFNRELIQEKIPDFKFPYAFQGNGGLSLRSTGMIKKSLEDKEFRKIINKGFDNLEKIPEDVYYSIYNSLYYDFIKNTEFFSIEPSGGFKEKLDFSENPFGFHKIYNFIDGDFYLEKFKKKLSIDKKIKNLNSPDGNDYEILKNHDLKNPEITVVITSYNYERYIENCINSVIKNKLEDIEILVVDDNSEDGSLSIIENFLNEKISFTLIKKKKNTGAIRSKNLGIKNSLGKYVFMLDADNEIYEDCLAQHLDYLKSKKLDAVYSIIDCFDESGNFIHQISNKSYNYSELKKCNYIDSMAMFDKEILMELGGYDHKILEIGDCLDDWELWLKFGYHNKKIGFIDKSLSKYLSKEDGMNQNSKYFDNELRKYLDTKFPHRGIIETAENVVLKIKIDFCNFWKGFNKTNNVFFDLLSLDFDIEISENPDILFYSVFDENGLYSNSDMNLEHKKYRCKKIFYSGEPIGPNYTECDYSMSFDWINSDRHFRLPLYSIWGDSYYRLENKKIDENLWDRKFCNFVVSNPLCSVRNDFFLKLNRYKKVDSGGRYLNNIGNNGIEDKLKFQSQYKFSLTFENTEYLGYTSEKITNSMIANSIPIYWGNPLIEMDFNKKSFINYYDFKNENELIEYIIHLDNNREEYLNKIREPWLIGDKIRNEYSKESIRNFLKKIVIDNYRDFGNS
jgi:glycosyltransferase involved in cell wall biosynthesis